MKPWAIILLTLLVSACGTTGGNIMPDGQTAVPGGKAVVAFSVQVTDGTDYDNCSVFVGNSAATAQWFAWPVNGDDVAMIALEVEPGNYGFHRFGCMYRALQLSTSVSGPQFTIAAGDIRYLGRLTLSDTQMGSAAGYSSMPNSVKLTFEDQRVEDFDALGRKWPLFTTNVPEEAIPASWGGEPRYQLRPYKDGVKLVASPRL